MNFIELVKWAWSDACDNSHSCLNNYEYEKGRSQWNLLITKDEWLEKQSFETLSKVYGCGLKKILVDILIPNLNGHTTQLDLVFINKSGIYVIEVKNYTCNAEGDNKDKWTRRELNGKVNKFQNPIVQNNNHIKCLQSLLTHYPDEYFKSIIVFADTCKFKYNNNSDLKYDTRVVNYKELKATIKEMIKSSETIFSDENIYRIYDKLSEYARYSNEDRKKHLEYVQSIKGVIN